MATDKPLAVVLVDVEYEDQEVFYPLYRLREAGFHVEVAANIKDNSYPSKHGYPCKSTKTFSEIDASLVKVMIIPGGWAPDRLRRYSDCLKLVKAVFDNGAVIGHICHGGWVPVSAGIMKGKKSTCFIAIKDDVINSGAEYSSDRCVVDGKMVSAQTPDDLPEFMKGVLSAAGISS